MQCFQHSSDQYKHYVSCGFLYLLEFNKQRYAWMLLSNFRNCLKLGSFETYLQLHARERKKELKIEVKLIVLNVQHAFKLERG